MVASGPVITCLDVPNRAYITMAPRATYRPATGVTPARSPKAIEDGTSTANTVIATMNSVRSSVGVRLVKRARPGMKRLIPFVGVVGFWMVHLPFDICGPSRKTMLSMGLFYQINFFYL